MLKYCAGIIDGEGHIGIHKKQGRNIIELRIQMDDEKPIRMLSKILKIGYFKHMYNNNKEHYLIAISQLQAYNTLKIIEPFLISKKLQAKKCIKEYEQQIKNKESNKYTKKSIYVK